MEFSYVKVGAGVIVAAQKREAREDADPGVKMVCNVLRWAELPDAEMNGLVFQHYASALPDLNLVALTGSGKEHGKASGLRDANVFRLGFQCSHGQTHILRTVAVVGQDGDPRAARELLDCTPESWHEMTRARRAGISLNNNRHNATIKMLMSLRPFVAVKELGVLHDGGQEGAFLIEELTETIGAEFLVRLEGVHTRRSSSAEIS